ncbi:Rieske 2Fe-2S domain-containing protein [Microbacterium sp. SYP-A9085]|uniref:Rieske (2Fe-2S) protein n=1 Tax=Microbacterium sp. SYP-A9085 TaxID=2664454 RepID=UPI00129B2686|nr:Rieske 2Fe-2S domain-containing protein [Microbacterium sp. SYP-A9085]MRH28003.1 Rieske 2Fe-2S domain-containing protein [Microbacterium sp. SYP-A9085]
MEVLAGSAGDFEDGRRRVLEVGGRPVVVFRVGERYYALSNTCLHSGGPVGEGVLIPRVEAVVRADGTVAGEVFSETCMHIVCPWHGWEYDIDTGRAAGDPRFALRRYETRTEGDHVYVIAAHKA